MHNYGRRLWALFNNTFPYFRLSPLKLLLLSLCSGIKKQKERMTRRPQSAFFIHIHAFSENLTDPTDKGEHLSLPPQGSEYPQRENLFSPPGAWLNSSEDCQSLGWEKKPMEL
jgi:hypothetical protein